MKKQKIDKAIKAIANNEEQYIFKLRNDPGYALRVMYLLQEILTFSSKYAFDKDGNKKKFTFLGILFNRELRKAFGAMIGKVIDLFTDPDRSS